MLLAVGFWGQVFTIVSLPVWFIGAPIARWAAGASPAPPELAWASRRLAKGPFVLACMVSLVWASLLPLTQT